MTTSRICAAAFVAAAMLAVAAPASASSQTSRDQVRVGESSDRVQLREHERVRKQQVRHNRNTPLYEPFFHPLYKGSDSPVQRMKRSLD